MKTTTQTQVTHYEVQKKRRESLLEEWRGYHKTVIQRADVEMHDVPAPPDAARGLRGPGRRPADHEPRRHGARDRRRGDDARSTATRWDAIMFIESGSGWTEIDGAAHRLEAVGHAPPAEPGPGTATATTATTGRRCSTPGASSRCSSSSAWPCSRRAATRRSTELPPRPRQVAPLDGADPYARRTQRLAGQWEGSESARLITRFEDVRGRRHQARRAQPVPGRQVDRLSHRGPVGGDARAGAGAATSRATATAARRGCTSSRATGYSTIDDVRHDWRRAT